MALLEMTQKETIIIIMTDLFTSLFGAVAAARVSVFVGRFATVMMRLVLLRMRLRVAQPAGDGVERSAVMIGAPSSLGVVNFQTSGRAAVVLASHGRDLLGGEPELLDDSRVADDHQEQRENQHDEQLVQCDDETNTITLNIKYKYNKLMK